MQLNKCSSTSGSVHFAAHIMIEMVEGVVEVGVVESDVVRMS